MNMETPSQSAPLPTVKPRKKKTWLIVLIIVAVVLIAGAAIGAWFFFKALSGPAEEAKKFLTTVNVGQLEQAYQSTAGIFQDETSFEDFQAFLDKYEIFKNLESFSVNEVNYDSSGLGKASGSIKGTDGSVVPITVTLVNENGRWKVATVELLPSDK